MFSLVIKNERGYPSMKKSLSKLTALLLCVVMIFCFASCSDTPVEEEEFVAATIDISDDIPVSEAEIIAFYNNIITALQAEDAFSSANKPGIKLSESIDAGDINILAYDSTGEAKEDGKLAALNSSANAIKNRIIGGIPTDSTVVGFGDINTPFTTIFHPGTGVSAIDADDIVSAECHIDGNKLYINLKLAGNLETVENIFGTRNKEDVIKGFNEFSSDYAEVTDYAVTYVEDAENNTYSTINMEVEVEKQNDGTYKCTGRILNIDIRVICDVAADVTCKGSFADNGNVQVNFRFTDNKNYTFDWLGTDTLEPAAEEVSE